MSKNITAVVGVMVVILLMLNLANTIGANTDGLNSTSLGTSNTNLAQTVVPLMWIIAIIVAPVALLTILLKEK